VAKRSSELASSDDSWVADALVTSATGELRKVSSMSRSGCCLRVSGRSLPWRGWLAGAGVASDRGCCRSRIVCQGPQMG